ncbi:traI [Symbiodinium necroappetens]|uniref:TraI protein n=1 Tax=Symbiodinium necroappetens TaxID=1628268 RepID=A0A813C8F2_9DINO|nr:traI [Symbiodinium necroappetens]
MLSIKAISSSSVASHYYSEADYYAKDGNEDIASTWQGNGAKRLGLDGVVDSTQFKAMLDGQLDDGTQVGRSNGNGEREHKKGWDFTLSAPKSVSVLALAGGDKRLIAAHNEAVSTALKHLEANYSITRQQVNGEIKEVLTKNLIVASFTHTTSRAMDPQLHTHNVIMNLTQRPDGEWRSLESRRMYDASKKIGQVYRNELASKVLALGYDIEADASKGTFDISAVPEAVRKGFSKRRTEILAAAKEYGYRTAKGMDNAAVRTRSAKHHSNQEALLGAWADQLKKLDYDPDTDIKAARNRHQNAAVERSTKAQQAADLEFARSHLAEREAVFTADDLQEQTLRASLGSSTIGSVEDAIAKEVEIGKLVPASLRNGRVDTPAYTTPAAIKKEQYIISLMQRGKRDVSRIAERSQISGLIEERGFTKGQAAAVRLLLSSKDRVVGVQGYAGTGKTYMLSAVREVAEGKGFKVTGLAPTGSAANLLQEETGIQSRTLASHLLSLKNTKKLVQNSKEILIVDESSLQNTQDAADLLTLSRQTRSRVFLIGDRQQLGAIEAGKPFDQLIKAGMHYAEMRDIMRQKDSPDLKAAVESSIEKKPRAALEHISKTVYEIKDRDKRIQSIVDRVLALPESERQKTLVLIPDNDTRREVNQMVRKGLQAKGFVEKEELKLKGLTNRGLSRAEKGRAIFYRKGDVVAFGREVASMKIKADIPYRVKETGKDELTLESENGKQILWNPTRVAGRAKNGVEVYRQEDRSIATGDEIRWRRKDKAIGVNNTDLGKVTSVDEKTGDVTIAFKRAGEKTINLQNNRHWEHAYATTVYSGQGATYDDGIVLAESWRRNLINQKSMYVALSRAKFSSHVYTDDVDDLAKGISLRPGEKTSALEGKHVNYARILDKDGLPKDLRGRTDLEKLKPILERIIDKVRRGPEVEMDI